jgi:hypothetical protein
VRREGGGAGSWLRSWRRIGFVTTATALTPFSFLAIALHLQHRTTTGSTSTFTNLPGACPTALSPRWGTNPVGTLPNACAPGSVPRSLMPHDRPSSSFGHVAHGCDTTQPVATQWRRRPRRTRRRQPRSRVSPSLPPPLRPRRSPAQRRTTRRGGAAHDNGRPAPTPWSEGQQGTLSSGVRGRVGHN